MLLSACSASTVRVAPPTTATVASATPAVTTTAPAGANLEQPESTSAATSAPAPSARLADAGPTSSTAEVAPTTEPDPSWTLLAGGDVLMDRSEAAGIDPFAGIVPPLAEADIAVINVEMAISDRGEPAADKQYVFRALPAAAARIAMAGVDVANLANNHAKDYGADALIDTIEMLESEGVIALGAGATSPDAYRHRIIEVRPGIRVAFVGASMVVPLGFPAGESRPGIASAYQRDRVLANVRVAAWEADVVIAVVHWGIERMTCPDGRQRDLAFELLHNGADAVIGHHPHVLQPVVFDDGKLIAYSLGNFIWHYRSGITGETGVLQIDFDGAEIVGWSFHPHLLDSNGAPVPATEGARVDRLTDIVSGDCARHQPPPISTPPEPDDDAESEQGAEAEPD
ncbi:CapA family protein [Candidatus Poriferisodalis sp.]|uniref:CapA family protein n=1 Tax=Candidatus Poriferisodalis sp. TaxID=3101277 RepID=UPI003D0C35C1